MSCHIGCRRNLGDRNLEEMCLSVIASNFGRYLAAYKLPNTKVPRRHLEFLERRYAERIFSSEEFKSLRFFGKLTPDHLDFFINAHTKELDLVYMLYGIQDSLLEGVINKLRTYGKNIVSFKASLYAYNEDFYSRLIALLPNLEKIVFQNIFSFKTPMCDYDESLYGRLISTLLYEVKTDFRCFPHLKVIQAIASNCSFLRVMKFPCHLHLHWGIADVYREDMHAVSTIIRHCPRLEILDFPDTVGVLYEMHKDYLKTRTISESEKYQLRTLSCEVPKESLSDALTVCAAFCPHSSYLNIYCLRSDAELERCLKFNFLEHVTFKWISGITPGRLNEFLVLKGSKLIGLDLHYTSCLSVLTLIQSCPRLQTLTLRNSLWESPICDDHQQPCEANLPSLRMLEFKIADFGVQAVTESLRLIISSAKNIRSLSLIKCDGLSKEFVRTLDLSLVQNLKIDKSDVKGDCLLELLTRGSLKKLELRDCRDLSYEDRLTLKRFAVVNISCRKCEKNSAHDFGVLYSKCDETCKRCNVLSGFES